MKIGDFRIWRLNNIMRVFPFYKKLLLTLTAGIVMAMTLLRIGRRMALEHGFPLVLAAIPAGLLLLVSLVYPFRWQRRERRMGADAGAVVVPWAFWQGLLRYGIALDLAMFGFQKLFRLQFVVPMAMLDQPESRLSGEDLTWTYFAHSYAFACVIGLFQIIGSVLLVYRRTKLIGVFTLLPVMVNICLLNFFYGFEIGEQVHAVVLLLGLLYLLFEEYPRLAALFLAKPKPPVLQLKGQRLRTIVRLSVLFLPVLLISGFHFRKLDAVIGGRYRVTRLWVNEAEFSPGNCSDSVMERVYFDRGDQCTVMYHGGEKMRLGEFVYDRNSGLVRISWHYPAGVTDSLVARIRAIPGGLGLDGRMGKLPVRMELEREP
jgi:hypothetical protein